MTSVLTVLAVQALILLGGVAPHHIQPFKYGSFFFFLIFSNTLQIFSLKTKFLAYGGFWGAWLKKSLLDLLEAKQSGPGSLRLGVKAFAFPLPWALVIFNPLALLYSVHQLMHIPSQLHGEGLSQIRIHGKPHFEGSECYVIEFPINLIKELPIPITVHLVEQKNSAQQPRTQIQTAAQQLKSEETGAPDKTNGTSVQCEALEKVKKHISLNLPIVVTTFMN